MPFFYSRHGTDRDLSVEAFKKLKEEVSPVEKLHGVGQTFVEIGNRSKELNIFETVVHKFTRKNMLLLLRNERHCIVSCTYFVLYNHCSRFCA